MWWPSCSRLRTSGEALSEPAVRAILSARIIRPSVISILIEGRYAVQGKTTNKEEFVSCGGVRLREVDFRTMESRIVPGLHFAGECLDIDGITGGFNFQAAWTTGHIAGASVANFEG